MKDIKYAQFYENERLDAVGSISDIECIEVDEEEFMRLYNSKPVELSCTIENQDELLKLAFGGDRGLYNGYVLNRDGYLSPENGWMDINGGT